MLTWCLVKLTEVPVTGKVSAKRAAGLSVIICFKSFTLNNGHSNGVHVCGMDKTSVTISSGLHSFKNTELTTY